MNNMFVFKKKSENKDTHRGNKDVEILARRNLIKQNQQTNKQKKNQKY